MATSFSGGGTQLFPECKLKKQIAASHFKNAEKTPQIFHFL
jgi:hypothetical protein